MENHQEKQAIALLQVPENRREAFEGIVRKYSKPLYWQIRRLVLSHDDANDLLQNTFIKAWQNIDYFRGDAKISTWLYRIAFNECLNFLNSKRAERLVSIDNLDTEILNTLESDPYFNGDEIQKTFLRAVHQLPPKQQMVFNLKYFKEMKYEEMSGIFGTSIGALKASYHHATKKIEAFMEKHL